MLKSDFQLDWREPGSFMLLFLCVKSDMFLLGLCRLDSFLLLQKKKKQLCSINANLRSQGLWAPVGDG